MLNNEFKLAGVTAGDAQENIKKFGCKDIGSFALMSASGFESFDDHFALEVIDCFRKGICVRRI